MNFLKENVGTILTGLVLIGIVTIIIIKIQKDRKNKTCFGCHTPDCCASCSCCMMNKI